MQFCVKIHEMFFTLKINADDLRSDKVKHWRKTSRFDRVQQYIQFFLFHQRRPHTKAKDPVEKSLADWFVIAESKHVHLLNEDRFYFSREDLIAFLMAGIKVRNQVSARAERKSKTQRVEQLISFLNQNHRRPLQHTEDSEESKLASWLFQAEILHVKLLHCSTDEDSDFEQPLGYFDADEVARIKAAGLEIRTQFSQSKSGEERKQELYAFGLLHQRRPSEYSKNPVEISLAKWLNTAELRHKKKLRQNKYYFSEMEIENFQSVGIEIRIEKLVSKEKSQRLLELILFLSEHQNRRPSKSALDSVERSLGAWFSHAKRLHFKKKYFTVEELASLAEHGIILESTSDNPYTNP